MLHLNEEIALVMGNSNNDATKGIASWMELPGWECEGLAEGHSLGPPVL
jgi:hypothetical protein